ncbi:unnamed protein product [Auanema sp. JU1783]|nr:unnamed protein product [Auanema sp. JU1783]
MSNDSECLNLNEELWEFRGDLTTRTPTMVIFSILYAIIIICGCVGNTCVILAITRNKTLQTVPNLFIISLSCSDIVVCCISATITPITAFRKEWIFGEALCRIAPFIAGISLCFSTFTLTAISIDRYMLIRFPMKKPLSHLQACGVIAFICTLAACISSPIIFKQTLDEFANFCGKYCTEDWSGNESQRRIYGAALLGVQLIVPLFIIILSYTAISIRIGQSMILKGAKQQSSDNWEVQLTDQQRMAVKRKQRTNRMLIAMVVAFSLSWIWSVSFNVLRDYDFLPEWIKEQEYLFGIGTHCVAMTSTVWNPLLYAMLNLQLRAAFVDLMPCWLRRKWNLEKTTSSRLLTENTRVPQTKYGTTTVRGNEQQMLKTLTKRSAEPAAFVVVDAISRDSRSESTSQRRESRKASVMRVLVQRVQKQDDQQHLISSDNSSSGTACSVTSPDNSEVFLDAVRRKSTAGCFMIVRQSVEFPSAPVSTLVRNSSF